ncbi:hypothetical protein ABZW03_27120, partial [Kitasatospora sp. NPDC004799]|uniref:hypothetical protein n=1 Tax=Kitasatospora sp. NPDC004799 TaxID=3154460 RepID=UPI0033B2B7D7
FRLPDMLANRADVWNLGDAVAGREDLFALSFGRLAPRLEPRDGVLPLAPPGRDRPGRAGAAGKGRGRAVRAV